MNFQREYHWVMIYGCGLNWMNHAGSCRLKHTNMWLGQRAAGLGADLALIFTCEGVAEVQWRDTTASIIIYLLYYQAFFSHKAKRASSHQTSVLSVQAGLFLGSRNIVGSTQRRNFGIFPSTVADKAAIIIKKGWITKATWWFLNAMKYFIYNWVWKTNLWLFKLAFLFSSSWAFWRTCDWTPIHLQVKKAWTDSRRPEQKEAGIDYS